MEMNPKNARSAENKYIRDRTIAWTWRALDFCCAYGSDMNNSGI